MTLIKSISGIRGTIGGFPGDKLPPLDVIKYTSSYGIWLKSRSKGKIKVVVGRDARISGLIVQNLVDSRLQSLGINGLDEENHFNPNKDDISDWFGGSPDWIKRS